MLVLGLTGGIACGKSNVSSALRELGAEIIDGDVLSRELTAPGGEALPDIRAAFGPGVFHPDGTLDRRALGAAIFGDAEKRARLDALMQPMILRRIREELERLERAGKERELEKVRRAADLANIFYVRQKETKGLGHAIWRAKRFVGDEPFAVLLGDDIMRSQTPVIGQLIAGAEKYGASCVGVQQVSTEAIGKYSSVKVELLEERIFRVRDMVEKPRPEEIFSNYAILGRYVLQPAIFNILENLKPGYGGEIQLTDGLKELCKQDNMVAVDFEGKRYDTGNLKGFLEATIDFSLAHPETGEWLKEFLKDKAKQL